MQYIGEIYSIDSEYGQKKLYEYKDKKCTYLMSITKNEVIDPTFKGNMARFINHSCEPNCETQKWHVLGEISVGIFTLKDINEGEELTFNYGFDIMKTTFQKCLCGVPTCRGYLGLVSEDGGAGISSSKGVSAVIICDTCKFQCKSNETILVCEVCKKIFHKNCAKKYKTNQENTLNNRDFICHHCVKKGYDINNLNNLSLTNNLSNFSISSKKDESKKEKKSSQQLIKDFKNKKKSKKLNIIEDIEESEQSSDDQNNERNNNLIFSNNTKIDTTVQENNSVCTSSNRIKAPKIIEEEPAVAETIEVEGSDLSKIKMNLKTLSNVGARLFWDFRQQSIIHLTNKIELKITGTQSQVDQVKEQIRIISLEKEEMYSILSQ